MKSSYIINHGLAPHFKLLLSQKIKCEPHEFVLLFDESIYSKTQNKQMDFHMRIWEGAEVEHASITRSSWGMLQLMIWSYF